MTGKIDILSILSGSEVFRRLSMDTLKQISGMARVERYEERTVIWQAGAQPPDHCRFIFEGAIEYCMTTPDGREGSIPLIRPGDWDSWAACLLDEPMTLDLWAMPQTTLIAFPRTLVRNAIIRSPEALLDAFARMSAQMRGMMRWSTAADIATDEERLAYLIYYLGDRNRDDSGEMARADITQEQISRYGLGSRHRVGRALKALEQQGLIELRYASIIVPCMARLRKFGY